VAVLAPLDAIPAVGSSRAQLVAVALVVLVLADGLEPVEAVAVLADQLVAVLVLVAVLGPHRRRGALSFAEGKASRVPCCT
jgi:hypothetical protein